MLDFVLSRGHLRGMMSDFPAEGPKLRDVAKRIRPSMAELETALNRVSGIRSASVVGDSSPTEIHVVAEANRQPKQVVRDVQSMAAAGFGMTIDHRIVSVVQMDDEAAEAVPVAMSRRPVVDRVVFANTGDGSWVKVALKWPSGDVTEGASAAGSSREARARGAAAALQQAIESTLDAGTSIEVDHVMIQQVGTSDTVIVRTVLSEQGRLTELVGSAVIQDDVATAAVHAFLQAVNRKLS